MPVEKLQHSLEGTMNDLIHLRLGSDDIRADGGRLVLEDEEQKTSSVRRAGAGHPREIDIGLWGAIHLGQGFCLVRPYVEVGKWMLQTMTSCCMCL